MAAGDLITTAYQVEYNGLLLGENTVYDIMGFDGLDLVAVREGDEKKPLDHGDLDLSPDLMPNRTVIIRGEIIDNSPTAGADLRNATSIRESFEAQLLPLVVRLHDGNKYQMNARCRRRAIYVDRDFALGFGNFTLMFWCPDPKIYSNTQYTAAVGAGFTGGAGFGFDIAFDISFGGGSTSAGQASCVNAGDISTAPVVTLHGPLTSPRLINDTTGQEWASNITLNSGDDLVVDFGNRTVTLGGSTRYSTVLASSVWWQLVPGNNVVRLSAPTGTGTGDVVWRSAYHALV